jgi:hypothetical protein
VLCSGIHILLSFRSDLLFGNLEDKSKEIRIIEICGQSKNKHITSESMLNRVSGTHVKSFF